MSKPAISSQRVLNFAKLRGIEVTRDGHGLWLAKVPGGWRPLGKDNFSVLNALGRIPRAEQAELFPDEATK